MRKRAECALKSQEISQFKLSNSKLTTRPFKTAEDILGGFTPRTR
jgi:hypothetical protein